MACLGAEACAVLLRDTPRSGCITVAEHIWAGVERTLIDLSAESTPGRTLSVTVSIGGAWLRDGEDVEAFVERADRALYQSKQNDRNLVAWETSVGEA